MKPLNLFHPSPSKTTWYISITCDYYYTHLWDVEPVINSAVSALKKISGMKISKKYTHTAQNNNRKYTMKTDVFYHKISFPSNMDDNVREALKPLLEKGLKLTDKLPN